MESNTLTKIADKISSFFYDKKDEIEKILQENIDFSNFAVFSYPHLSQGESLEDLLLQDLEKGTNNSKNIAKFSDAGKLASEISFEMSQSHDLSFGAWQTREGNYWFSEPTKDWKVERYFGVPIRRVIDLINFKEGKKKFEDTEFTPGEFYFIFNKEKYGNYLLELLEESYKNSIEDFIKTLKSGEPGRIFFRDFLMEKVRI